MPESSTELARFLAEEWTRLLGQILESMTDQKPAINWEMASTSPEAAGMQWWEQRLSLADAPVLWVGAPEPALSELGARTLRAAGIDSPAPADTHNTYLEILNQSLSGLAQSLGARAGREITCATGYEVGECPASAVWVAVSISYPDADLPGISLGFSLDLAELLEPSSAPAPASAALPRAASVEGGAGPVAPPSRTLDLLLEVELPVSVSFGRAELPLKEVLKLTTGSIVELNRGVNEPVEIIVNNCVVARGEVVVIDGNYGVRIHQIVSPQERLRTLK